MRLDSESQARSSTSPPMLGSSYFRLCSACVKAHTRTLPDASPEAMNLPVGENLATLTVAAWSVYTKARHGFCSSRVRGGL